MSIHRGDFSPSHVAAIDAVAERLQVTFAAAVRVLLDRALYQPFMPPNPAQNVNETLTGETYIEGSSPDSREGGGVPSTEETSSLEREGGGEAPQLFGESTSRPEKRRRAKKTEKLTSIPDPPEEIDSPELRDLLPRFAEHRRSGTRNPIPIESELAWKRFFALLVPHGRKHAPLAVLYAMSRGWKVFDKKYMEESNPKGWNWDQVASELGLSLRKEEARVDPAAEAEADRQRLRSSRLSEFRNSLLLLTPSVDGWTDSSRSTFLPPESLLDDPGALQACLAQVEALTHRLVALGALPLRPAPPAYRASGEKFEPGLIFPACGGGPWRPNLLRDGWRIDDLSAGRTVDLDEGWVAPVLNCNASPPPEKVEEVYERHARRFDSLVVNRVEHICTVCLQPVEAHPSACDACDGTHWPPLCCEGCDCGSFEATHANA